MKRIASALLVTALVSSLAGCVQVTRTEPAASPATAVVVPPGSGVVTVTTPPHCAGAYSVREGTNFGPCPGAAASEPGGS